MGSGMGSRNVGGYHGMGWDGIRDLKRRSMGWDGMGYNMILIFQWDGTESRGTATYGIPMGCRFSQHPVPLPHEEPV